MTGLIDPADAGFEITPSDTVDLERNTRGLYVGGIGDVTVDMAGGGTITFVALSSGVIHPLQVKRVYATGTDASDIIGVY